MGKVRYILYFLIAIPAVLLGQETQSTDGTMAYLEHNGTVGQYEYAYDGLLKMLEGRFPETEANKNGWAHLRENKQASIDEIIKLLVPVYEKHFGPDEIRDMNAFYRSPTGKQLVADRSKMTEEQKQELNGYYNSPVGRKIIEKQTVLTDEISKISENWSRDLYETALSLLR